MGFPFRPASGRSRRTFRRRTSSEKPALPLYHPATLAELALTKSNKSDIISSILEMQSAGAAFLITDLKLALTMLDAAELLSTRKRACCYQNARSAYEAVVLLRPHVRPSHQEREVLDRLEATLKARLALEPIR